MQRPTATRLRLRRPVLFLALGLTACALLSEATAAQNLDAADGEILVKFRSTVSASSAQRDLRAAGIEPTRYIPELRLHQCRVVSNQDVASAVATCQAHPDIDYAEPNYFYDTSVVPDDPRFEEQWALHNNGRADIDAPQAWDVTTGARRIIVAVTDTGLETTHPDLADNLWRNPGESGEGRESNGIDDDDNGYVDDVIGWNFVAHHGQPVDDNGHGTHVAGIIAARGNNGQGISGVAWETSLMPLKFLDQDGRGRASDAVAAIVYAAANGARIINASWGGGASSQALADAIAFARQHKVLVIAAAGNERRDNDRHPTYPANYDFDNVLSVAATDQNDALSEFSNHGALTVDLAAPGSDILSTIPGPRYMSLSGTSMATPHVSGVAALVLAQYPSLRYRQTMIRVVGGAEPLQSLATRTRSGGRLNAYGALSTHPRVAFVLRMQASEAGRGGTIVQAEVTDDDSLQSVALHYALEGEGYHVTSMQPVDHDTFRGWIPRQASGARIEYFVRGVDADGNSGLSPTRRFVVGP